jgi:hypothetical protein
MGCFQGSLKAQKTPFKSYLKGVSAKNGSKRLSLFLFYLKNGSKMELSGGTFSSGFGFKNALKFL